MAALGRGVPLLCTPMGRDQFYNAERVEALGAGRMLMPDSTSEAIAQAATDILGDDRFGAGAKRMAAALGRYGGAGLDVFEHGHDINPRLREAPNVVMLPHMGSATVEGRIEMGEKVIINIKTFADGHRPPDLVLPGML